VNYADLNLQHHEGVVTLYRRIRNAADFVCYDADRRSIQSELSARTCTAEATTRAVDQVGSPELKTLHAQQTHKPTTTMMARQSH
jgi:UrcA family protein